MFFSVLKTIKSRKPLKNQGFTELPFYLIGICALAGTTLSGNNLCPIFYLIGICALAGTPFYSLHQPVAFYLIGICALAGTLRVATQLIA
jgi:hypothetical protein